MLVKLMLNIWQSMTSEVTDLEVVRYNFNVALKSERNNLHENMCGAECAVSNRFFECADKMAFKPDSEDTDYLDMFRVSLWKGTERKDIIMNGKIYVMENGKTSDKHESFRIEWGLAEYATKDEIKVEGANAPIEHWKCHHNSIQYSVKNISCDCGCYWKCEVCGSEIRDDVNSGIYKRDCCGAQMTYFGPNLTKACIWTQIEDYKNQFDTSCGDTRIVTGGSPYLDKVNFCENCGGKVEELEVELNLV